MASIRRMKEQMEWDAHQIRLLESQRDAALELHKGKHNCVDVGGKVHLWWENDYCPTARVLMLMAP